ncbi:DNA-binding protein WhiA [Metamycoplasma equirhinis]|uniref:DNA-binding protein WhiA n=1 Tax=Metamycoplasma equirhinis TaxID=92402 RepID=UPI003593AD4B
MDSGSFTLNIKKEIMARQLNKSQKLNLLNGIITSAKIKNNQAHVILNNLEIYEFLKKILLSLKINFEVSQKNSIDIDINLIESTQIKKERDFFAGIFLVSGSISDSKSVYNHLELNFFEEENAKAIVKILNDHNLNFKIIERRSKYIAYVKKLEDICDFLKAIEAIDSYYEFEVSKIERDYLNNINRITNFDIYNQERIAQANVLFLHNLKFIKENNLEEKFSPEELRFFKIKKENLDSSLSELTQLAIKQKIYKSRSGFNHTLMKLKKIAEKFDTKNK